MIIWKDSLVGLEWGWKGGGTMLAVGKEMADFFEQARRRGVVSFSEILLFIPDSVFLNVDQLPREISKMEAYCQSLGIMVDGNGCSQDDVGQKNVEGVDDEPKEEAVQPALLEKKKISRKKKPDLILELAKLKRGAKQIKLSQDLKKDEGDFLPLPPRSWKKLFSGKSEEFQFPCEDKLVKVVISITKEFRTDEEGKRYRYFACKLYDECLYEAARKLWPGFGCVLCPNFRDSSMNREADTVEVDFGNPFGEGIFYE